MKYQILPVMAALVCLLTVLFSGTAYAQNSPLDIALDFCEDVENASNEAGDDLDEAVGDLLDCPVEFDDCQSGIFENSAASCISEFIECTSDSYKDAQQICSVFERKMGDAYEDALRNARWFGPDKEKAVQTLLADPLRQQCFAPAVGVALLCSERLTSGGSP